jgi:hypothetical protein
LRKASGPFSSESVNAVPGVEQFLDQVVADKAAGTRDRDVHESIFVYLA